MASDQARDAPLSREAMIGVVERLHRTWSRGDLSVIADLYAPNFTAHFPFGWEFNGRSGVRKAIEDVRRAFSGWTETIQDIIIESDKAVRRYVSTGVQRWPLPRPGSHRRTHCRGRDIDFPFRGAPHSGAVVRDVAPAGRLSVVAWLMVPVSGTEGYADEAEALAKQYESISFAEVHRQVIHLIPTAPSRLLDIGAGTGRDAAAFAAMGHSVMAVEPTAELRLRAVALHPSPQIQWLDDSLPDLVHLHEHGEIFDVVMLTAVWMHLDQQQRRRAMPRVAGLVRAGGVMILSLRHGPVPLGRRMFEVTAAETIRLAQAHDLRVILKYDHQDGLLGRPGVTWTRLAFSKSQNAPRCRQQ